MNERTWHSHDFDHNGHTKSVYYTGGIIGRVRRDGNKYDAIDRYDRTIGTHADPNEARQQVKNDYINL